MSMSLRSLEESALIVKDAESKLIKERAIRDELIKDALESGVTYKTLQRVTGLSRDRLFNIGKAGAND